jgi:hypothetical protein
LEIFEEIETRGFSALTPDGGSFLKMKGQIVSMEKDALCEIKRFLGSVSLLYWSFLKLRISSMNPARSWVSM